MWSVSRSFLIFDSPLHSEARSNLEMTQTLRQIIPRSWLMAVLQLALYFASESDPGLRLVPLLSSQTFGKSTAALCGEAIGSGQAVEFCNLVGEGYTMGSAVDLLAASRFKGFSLDAPAISSDRNTLGIVAYFTIETTRRSARVDATKHMSGYAQVRKFYSAPVDGLRVHSLLTVVAAGCTYIHLSDRQVSISKRSCSTHISWYLQLSLWYDDFILGGRALGNL